MNRLVAMIVPTTTSLVHHVHIADELLSSLQSSYQNDNPARQRGATSVFSQPIPHTVQTTKLPASPR
jgi:hypothetical protein